MITTVFFTNFLLGFVLAAEFGQVGVEVFRRGIRFGFREAFRVSLGATFADFVYLNIAITGIIIFLNRPDILRVLWIIGGVSVLYLGVRGMIDGLKKDEKEEREVLQSNSFIAGFLLNFVHPVNLLWWVTLLGSILVADMKENSFLVGYLDGMGICFGVFLWWIILSALATFAKRWVTVRSLRYISVASSCVLIGFSFWFFSQAWSM